MGVQDTTCPATRAELPIAEGAVMGAVDGLHVWLGLLPCCCVLAVCIGKGRSTTASSAWLSAGIMMTAKPCEHEEMHASLCVPIARAHSATGGAGQPRQPLALMPSNDDYPGCMPSNAEYRRNQGLRTWRGGEGPWPACQARSARFSGSSSMICISRVAGRQLCADLY
jgi:hypothetical protein